MAIQRNNAEGGATVGDGVAVTAANSGGGSGRQFNLVPTAGTVPFLYDNSTAKNGTFSYEFSSGATTAYGQFTISSTNFSGVVYVKLDQARAAADHSFMRLYSGGTLCAALGLSSAGMMRCHESGSVVSFEGTNPLPFDGQWYRFEWAVTQSAGTATIKAAMYVGDSAGALETLTKTGTANTGSAPFDGFRVGKLTTTGTTAFHMDEIAFEEAAAGAFLGPAPAVAAPTVEAGNAQYPIAGATISVSATETGSFSGGLWSFTRIPVDASTPVIAAPSASSTSITLPNVGGQYDLRRRLTYSGGVVDDSLTLWVNSGPAADVEVHGEFDSSSAYPNEGGAPNRTAALNDTSTATGVAEPTADSEKKFVMRPYGVGPMSFYTEGYSRGGALTRTVTVYKEDGTTPVQVFTTTPGAEISNISEAKFDLTTGLATLTGVNDAATLILRRAVVVGFKWA